MRLVLGAYLLCSIGGAFKEKWDAGLSRRPNVGRELRVCVVNLGLPEESTSLIQMFERVFEAESAPARVRAAEPSGFDAALWRTLAELGVQLMRVPAARGGSELSLLDAMMMMEQAGRRLASVPLAEAIVAARLLAQSDGPRAAAWLERLGTGDAGVSFALQPPPRGER